MVIAQRRNACHEAGQPSAFAAPGPPQNDRSAPACEDQIPSCLFSLCASGGSCPVSYSFLRGLARPRCNFAVQPSASPQRPIRKQQREGVIHERYRTSRRSRAVRLGSIHRSGHHCSSVGHRRAGLVLQPAEPHHRSRAEACRSRQEERRPRRSASTPPTPACAPPPIPSARTSAPPRSRSTPAPTVILAAQKAQNAETAKLAQQQQAAEKQIGAVSSDVASVKTDVGGVKTDVATTRSDLEATKAQTAEHDGRRRRHERPDRHQPRSSSKS